MTKEEAFEKLEQTVDIYLMSGNADDTYCKEWRETLEALKEEPKTVIYSGDGYADGYMVYDTAECPNCGYEYEEGDKDWKEPFCPHCGQALEWESEVSE